jgi:hypothetical protein
MNSSSVATDLAPIKVEDTGYKYAHYGEATSVTEGYVLGKSVLAICGALFIPSRDPNRFPICPVCKNIAEALFLDI